MAEANRFFTYIRANKWRLRIFSVGSGVLLGIIFALIQPANLNSLGILPNFVISSFAVAYTFYFFLDKHGMRIYSIESKTCRQIVNFRNFGFWGVLLFGLAFFGSLLFLQYPSELLAIVWLFSLIFLIIIYPCIASLAIYIQSFRYLRYSEDGKAQKKNIVDSMIIATIGLAIPWIMVLFFLSAFLSVPAWLEIVLAITSYVVLFFIAIDLPYYQSMEEIKKKKSDGLRALRERLVEKLCEDNLTERVAIELNIERIDRDIQTLASESSHPYSIIKSLGAFAIVTVFGGMLANLFVELIKLIPH